MYLNWFSSGIEGRIHFQNVLVGIKKWFVVTSSSTATEAPSTAANMVVFVFLYVDLVEAIRFWKMFVFYIYYHLFIESNIICIIFLLFLHSL